MKREFEVGGLKYSAYFDEENQFFFDLVAGNSKKGAVRSRFAANDLFYDERPNFDDVDLNVSALPVFAVVVNILVEWVVQQKKWYFGFSASSERKIRVYRWLANRIIKRLPKYSMLEEPEGCFNFYRQTM